MSRYRIPFNRPGFVGRELDYIARAVAEGHTAGDGPFTKRCEDILRESLGVSRVLLTTSGTHALEMAAFLLDIRPGDEIIVPSFTFVSTANAFVLRGARPVFADIRPDTLNLDESRLERHITSRTRAILPVHYAGVGCEMESIGEIAARRGVTVVEDNAHGLFATYRGKPLGTFGALGVLSFHETKNFICGEGGALILGDPAYARRAEVLREKGTNRSQFFRGEADRYTWVDVGSSYVLSDLLAAFLCAQLEAREAILARRRLAWERYRERLESWCAGREIALPVVPPQCVPSYHMFHLLAPTAARRDALLSGLRARGILAVFHYVPLHVSPMGRSLGGRPGDCPVTENVAGRLLRLPFYNDITPLEQDEVVDALRAAWDGAGGTRG